MRTGDRGLYVNLTVKAWRVAAIRSMLDFQMMSGERVVTSERRAHVDVILKALEVAVRFLHHFQVESGERARQGNQGVHWQGNEDGHHPLGRNHHRLPCRQKTVMRVHRHPQTCCDTA